MHGLTEQMKRIPRIRIATISVKPPLLEEMPPKWRVFKKLRAESHNFSELERFDREIIAAVNKYEEEAEKWRSRQHFERAGWLCEMAAIELGRLIRNRGEGDYDYQKEYESLVVKAFNDFKAEITVLARADPNLYLGMARCLKRVLKEKEAREADIKAHKQKERMSSEPSFFAIVTINRLKKAILENSYDCEIDNNKILDLMGQIIDFTTGASARIQGIERKQYITDIESWLMNEGIRIFGTASEEYKMLLGILDSLRPELSRKPLFPEKE